MTGKRLQLQQIRNENCTQCSLCTTKGNVCVMGRGSPHSRIMLIGEAPGEAEAQTGKPFMGQAGQLLTKVLQNLGIADRVYITNVCKCRPPKNRNPTGQEVQTCTSLYLIRELRLLRPRVIVCLGKVSTSYFFKGGPFTRNKPTVVGDIPVIPTWHPAYYFYSGQDPMVLKGITSALQQAKEIANENLWKPLRCST